MFRYMFHDFRDKYQEIYPKHDFLTNIVRCSCCMKVARTGSEALFSEFYYLFVIPYYFHVSGTKQQTSLPSNISHMFQRMIVRSARTENVKRKCFTAHFESISIVSETY